MDPLSRDALEERLALLVSGQFAELRSLTRGQDDKQNEQLHRWFADADIERVDLVDAFELCFPAEKFGACYTLLPAIGLSSRADASRLLRLLRFIPAERDGELPYHVGEVLTARFTSQSGLALDVAAQFDSGEPLAERAYRVWANSFAMAQPVLATQFILDRLGHPVGESKEVRALLLALPWGREDVRHAVEPYRHLLLRYLTALVEVSPEDGWYCIVQLAQFDPEAFRRVADMLEQGVPQVVSNVAHSILRLDNATYGAGGVPLAGVLNRLVQQSIQDQSVARDVDTALTSCLWKSSLRPIAVDCIRALGEGPDEVSERFSRTFQSLLEHEAAFRSILTGWLLSPTASFSVIRDMFSFVSAQRALAELDEEQFAAATSERRTKAVRRLLGLLGDGPSLCQFAANIARMARLGDAGLILSGQMFNVLKDEFPGGTEEFLKELCLPALRNERGAHVFRGVYAAILRWGRHLERLPRRPELRLSEAETHALRNAKIKLNSIIQRGAEEMSVFASAVTKVHLAQGHRFTTHMQQGTLSISGMGHFSQSIELPSSELSDPMRGYIHRMEMLENAR